MEYEFKLENSILKDENGQNILLFHSTDTKIDRFYPLSHFGTEKASARVSEDIFRNRYQYTNYEELAQRIDEEACSSVVPKYNIDYTTYLVNLSITKPLIMDDIGMHSEPVKWESWMRGNYWNKPFFKKRYSDEDIAQRNAQALYRFIFKNPDTMKEDELRYELSLEKLYDPNEAGKDDARHLKKRVKFQRLIRYLEKEGFDGVQYKNTWEDKGSISYIVFRPEQVFFLGEKDRHYVSINDFFEEKLDQRQKDFLAEEVQKPYVEDKAESKMQQLFNKVQCKMKKELDNR